MSKLNETPTKIDKGVRAWRNPGNGYVVALVHYEADPDSTSKDKRMQGLNEAQYRREHDLDFSSWAGQPVFPEFDKKVHVSGDIHLPDNKETYIWRGWDFGYRRPAVVFSIPMGQGGWWVLGEVLGEDVTLEKFVQNYVIPYQQNLFPDARFIDAADPAGRAITDRSEYTSFTILAQLGIFPLNKKSEISEGLTTIHKQLIRALETQDLQVPNGLLVHPRCRQIIEGFTGGYRYPEPTPSKPAPEMPLKDGYFDHLFDAIRYTAVNAISLWPGQKPKTKKPKETHVDKVLKSKRRTSTEFDEFGLEI